jgi:orotidine-5'-phosphate decarboxylase
VALPATDAALIAARASFSNPANRLVLALDVPGEPELRALVTKLRGKVGLFKIGKELFTALGPRAVQIVLQAGGSVFLDLKFHDIPNTVAGAVRSAGGLGVRLLTVHAAGGRAMVAAAAEAARSAATPPLVLAVTVLTSLGEGDLGEIGFSGTAAEAVGRLGRLAVGAGADGLVASPREIALLRTELGARPLLVIPGIRPPGAATGDQQRTATPAQAIRDGADYLVIGRPITQAPDPVAAAEASARSL